MAKIKTVTFVIACCVILVTSCNEDDCKNEIMRETYNPQGNKKAILFQKECGATVDNSLHVSVVEKNYKLSNPDKGNTCIIDGNHSATALDGNSVQLVWLSSDTLEIEYDHKLNVFTKNTKLKDVTVVYKEL